MLELPKCTVGDIGKPAPTVPQPPVLVARLEGPITIGNPQTAWKRGDIVRVKRFCKRRSHWEDRHAYRQGYTGRVVEVLGDGYRLDFDWELVWQYDDLESAD
jgi:hypothetical protein